MDEKWMNGKDFWKDDRRYSCIFGDSFFSGGCLQVSLLLPATVRDLGDMFSAWYCWDDFLLLRSWVWWLTNMFMRFKSLNWFCHVCGQSMWDSWDMLGYKMGQTWIPLVERNWPSERWGFFLAPRDVMRTSQHVGFTNEHGTRMHKGWYELKMKNACPLSHLYRHYVWLAVKCSLSTVRPGRIGAGFQETDAEKSSAQSVQTHVGWCWTGIVFSIMRIRILTNHQQCRRYEKGPTWFNTNGAKWPPKMDGFLHTKW